MSSSMQLILSTFSCQAEQGEGSAKVVGGDGAGGRLGLPSLP
jgi:hypothetical protein